MCFTIPTHHWLAFSLAKARALTLSYPLIFQMIILTMFEKSDLSALSFHFFRLKKSQFLQPAGIADWLTGSPPSSVSPHRSFRSKADAKPRPYMTQTLTLTNAPKSIKIL